MNRDRQKTLIIVLIVIAAFGLYYFFKPHTALAPLELQKNPNQNQVIDTVAEPAPEPVIIAPETNEYYLYTISDTNTLASLKKELGAEKFAIVLALNHVDYKFVGKDTKLVVPKKFPDNIQNFLLDYSPLPKNLPQLSGVPKFILISQKVQYIGAYENGILVYSAPVSTGKKSTQTPNGLFTANWKAKRTISTVDSSWILPWAVNLDNFEGISMHQYELPGYPASHSCIRMREIDAKWIYDFTNQWQLTPDGKSILTHGTPVVIFGNYEYGKTRPWFNLPTDPDYLNITDTEVNTVIEPLMEKIIAYTKENI